MTIDEMQNYLTQVQKELPTTKILNAIMTKQQDIDALRTAVIEVQQKVNEIISAINSAAATAEEEDTSKEEAVAIED